MENRISIEEEVEVPLWRRDVQIQDSIDLEIWEGMQVAEMDLLQREDLESRAGNN